MQNTETKTQINASPEGRPQRDRLWGGLLVRRQRWTLCRPAKILLVALALGAVWLLKEYLQSFLALTDKVPAEILVVEGWSPPYAMKQAAALFWEGKYKRMLVTRAIFDPQDEDELNPRSTEYMVRVLVKYGAPRDKIDTVYSTAVRKDRTFHSALSVKQWLRQHGLFVESLDVATMGTHARRSRLLYQKAFGDGFKIGVISMDDVQYDPARWWATSEGVREVLSESIAYVYARLIFHAASPDLSRAGN